MRLKNTLVYEKEQVSQNCFSKTFFLSKNDVNVVVPLYSAIHKSQPSCQQHKMGQAKKLYLVCRMFILVSIVNTVRRSFQEVTFSRKEFFYRFKLFVHFKLLD